METRVHVVVMLKTYNTVFIVYDRSEECIFNFFCLCTRFRVESFFELLTSSVFLTAN